MLASWYKWKMFKLSLLRGSGLSANVYQHCLVDIFIYLFDFSFILPAMFMCLGLLLYLCLLLNLFLYKVLREKFWNSKKKSWKYYACFPCLIRDFEKCRKCLEKVWIFKKYFLDLILVLGFFCILQSIYSLILVFIYNMIFVNTIFLDLFINVFLKLFLCPFSLY